MKEENQNIIKYIKFWTGLIDLHSYLQRIEVEEDRNTAENIMELLEKSATAWQEDTYDLWPKVKLKNFYIYFDLI